MGAIDRYDFVRVKTYDRYAKVNLDKFLGQEGMIITVNNGDEYPIEVCFFDKGTQVLSLDYESMFWKEHELEVIN